MTPRRWPALGISVLAAVLVGGAGLAAQDAAEPEADGSPVVVITDRLDPSQLEIEAGTSVTWRNEDGERHRVRSREGPERFDSGNLERGESFTFTFQLAGTYPYVDHRDRENGAYFGTIVVTTAGLDGDGPLPESASVSIFDETFRPGSLAIATGGTVTWRNDEDDQHTVTATDSSFTSDVLDEGGTFSQTFTEPGSYPYTCLIHPEMHGTIEVQGEPVSVASADPVASSADPVASADPEAGGPVAVSIIDRLFQPADVEVAVGSSILWSNDDSEGHTVTALDGSFNSGVMTVGAAYETTFATAGTVDYFCAIHPEMTGTVTVIEPVGAAPPAAADSPPPEAAP